MFQRMASALIKSAMKLDPFAKLACGLIVDVVTNDDFKIGAAFVLISVAALNTLWARVQRNRFRLGDNRPKV